MHQLDTHSVGCGDIAEQAAVHAFLQLDRKSDAFGTQCVAKRPQVTVIQKPEMIGAPFVVAGVIVVLLYRFGRGWVFTGTATANDDDLATDVHEDLRCPSCYRIGGDVSAQHLHIPFRGGFRVLGDDMDVIELNEAFAVQALSVIRELDLPLEKVNVNGGAVALGHPLGCTGARMTLTALGELERREARYALVTMCIGGGMGAAGVFERI